jgi:hypothetical protein
LGGGGLVCLLCGAALNLTALPHAIVAIHACRDNFKQTATSGPCRTCLRRHQTAAGLATAVHEYLRANLMSAADSGGRARLILLVTADKYLAEVACAEDIPVWDVGNKDAPSVP